jgi:hypothetical protein
MIIGSKMEHGRMQNIQIAVSQDYQMEKHTN